MIVLDTDHVSCLEWGSTEAATLRDRLNAAEDQNIVTTVVSYEEQMRGWMAYIAKAGKPEQHVKAYSQLRKHLQLYCSIPLLDFDADASQHFEQLRASKIRIGAMDLRIASICLSKNALLLTRNTVDFEKVPNLRFEDWTLPS